MNDFVIPFKGLDVGNHIFNFEICDEFFESYEYFENIRGKASVEINLLNEPNMMILDFSISGDLTMQCDRCLGVFNQQVSGKNQLIIKYGDKFIEESEDVIVIPFTESRIDLKQYIFEYLGLCLPVRKIHPMDAEGNSLCDPEITDMINSYSRPKSDPRWDALKGLKL